MQLWNKAQIDALTKTDQHSLLVGGYKTLRYGNVSPYTCVVSKTQVYTTDTYRDNALAIIDPWTDIPLDVTSWPTKVWVNIDPALPSLTTNDSTLLAQETVDANLSQTAPANWSPRILLSRNAADVTNNLLPTNTFVQSVTAILKLTNISGGDIVNFPAAVTWPAGWFSGLVALGFSGHNSYSVDPTIYLKNPDGTILYPNVQPNSTYAVTTTTDPANEPVTFNSFPSNTADLAVYVNGSGALPDDTITITYFLKMAGVVVENTSPIDVITQGASFAATDLTSVETTQTLITTSQVGSNLVTKLILTLGNNGTVALPADTVFELIVNGNPCARFCPGAIAAAGAGGPTVAPAPYEIDLGDGVSISPNGVAVSCYNWGSAAPVAGLFSVYKQ